MMMKIKGKLIDILIEIRPETYSNYVVIENGQRVLYVKLVQAFYSMLISAVLCYKKLRHDLEDVGFLVNPYDICVANQIIQGTQHTVVWHVDDIRSSHMLPEVNDQFLKLFNNKYASDGIRKVKSTRGKIHPYLGMVLNYSNPRKLKIEMTQYINQMILDFPIQVKGNAQTPWTNELFKNNKEGKSLDEERKRIFHTYFMKTMFLCKRGRPDIATVVALLSTRVREPTESDWLKLIKMMSSRKGTKEEILSLKENDS